MDTQRIMVKLVVSILFSNFFETPPLAVFAFRKTTDYKLVANKILYMMEY